jgi:hypothetical protein
MSRRLRELRIETKDRWPMLDQFLGAYCHQDWPEDYDSPEGAVDAAISDHPLEMRQEALRQWRDWNASVGIEDDVRKLVNDGFGVSVFFKRPIDGRNFMNLVYDKLILSVRNEVGKDWKP